MRSRDTAAAYAGIGSRRTPNEILVLMESLAERLAEEGWTLRSGGARGADQAFIAGAQRAGGAADVYLPWPGYEGIAEPRLQNATPAALDLAAFHHPAWGSCRRGAKALHARNCHQILGATLDDPSSFVVCWTPDGSLDGAGASSGGTGQALRIASSRGIAVVNLARPPHRQRVVKFLA
jgi:hypothetical protein